jgi:hypothetical protein
MRSSTSAFFLTGAMCFALGAPSFANKDTTEVLEEFFEVFGSSSATLQVLEKRDGLQSTRWNNVTINDDEKSFEATLPWIEVNKKLLGGYSLTLSPAINFTGVTPELGSDMTGVINTENLIIDINYKNGNREYSTSFSGADVKITSGDEFDMAVSVGSGSSNTVKIGEIMTGAFDYSNLDLDYSIFIEGEDIRSKAEMTKMIGRYRSPIFSTLQADDFESLLAGGENFFIEYGMEAISSSTTMPSPQGSGTIAMVGKESNARMSIQEGNVSISGDGSEIEYTVSMPSMGMPPMKVKVADLSSVFGVPVDNTDLAKLAMIQLDLKGLELDSAIWAMFDPKGVLPQNKADMKIDLEGNLKWASKISELIENPTQTLMPVVLEDAKVTALNLSALGAELKTTGKFNIDNSAFPPAPSGTVDVSLKGANSLMDQLSAAGLLPLQNGMVAKGMMSMFFKQGGEGSDHLTSQIIFSPDGSISANGFPLK